MLSHSMIRETLILVILTSRLGLAAHPFSEQTVLNPGGFDGQDSGWYDPRLKGGRQIDVRLSSSHCVNLRIILVHDRGTWRTFEHHHLWYI